MKRPIHHDFQYYLDFKDKALIDLYNDLRNTILELCPEANELLYHTHALSSVYSTSDRLGDGFVMIPIYTSHLNLGFHKGTILNDEKSLLKGTGKLIRHIPLTTVEEYNNIYVKALILQARDLAIEDMTKPSKQTSATISKIKR